MQTVAVGWQVYDLTGRELDLGYVGLAQFVPSILLSLVAGEAADRFERRRLLLACYGILTACTASLAWIARQPRPEVWWIYAVLVAVGLGRTFAGPAAQSLVPNLVESAHFPNAVAWSSSIWHVALVAGPALGGLVYAWARGAMWVYAVAAALQLIAMVSIAALPAPPSRGKSEGAAMQRLLAGLRFVWTKRMILGAISLDMFAVLFGGAVALLPVYARDILQVGPTGLGLLRSAPAIGATVCAVVLAFRPIRRRSGLAMFAGVAVFGVATIVFGLSRNFFLSLAALFVTGCGDMVSVFIRHSLVQLGTPDGMRGRVSAVNLAFIGVSNELGEFESGAVAAWLGTIRSVVIGGVGSCVIVALWILLFPSLRRVDSLDAAELSKS
jgi:MFS family permease